MSNCKITFVEHPAATACSKCDFRLSDPYENEMRTVCAFDLMAEKRPDLQCRSHKEGRADGKEGYFVMTQEV